MKTLAAVLSLLLCAPVLGQETSDQAPEQAAPQRRNPGVPNLIFKPTLEVPPAASAEAQAQDEELTKELKGIRLAGGATAGAGVGLLIAAVLVDATTGPVGWAATLIFFGGLSAYLAHRRLQGHHDFSKPSENPPSPPAPAPQRPESPIVPQPVPAPQPQGAPGV